MVYNSRISLIPRLLHVDDPPFKYIDPKLLRNPDPGAPIEAPHTFTPDTQPDLKIFPPPSFTPAAYGDGDHSAVTPANSQLPLYSETPTQRAPPISSRGGKNRPRVQSCSPRHKKRRAEALEGLVGQPYYHSLPANDREYFDQVITRLRGASHLTLPQSLEPTVESAAGRQLVEPHRITGPGAAAARESVYAVLVDRPEEGDYVCWICGETRADRRLIRALDHVRGHFEHRPYRCSETHIDQHIGVVSVW